MPRQTAVASATTLSAQLGRAIPKPLIFSMKPGRMRNSAMFAPLLDNLYDDYHQTAACSPDLHVLLKAVTLLLLLLQSALGRPDLHAGCHMNILSNGWQHWGTGSQRSGCPTEDCRLVPEISLASADVRLSGNGAENSISSIDSTQVTAG